MDKVSKLSIDTIRTLALDSVESAQHGHLGMPLGSAPMAYELWMNHLSINPENPEWFDRDRFVLSAGHGSILNYILLHLSGFDLTIDDLKRFRQIGSKTPGHPEYGHTEGIEVTTGPLGQGIGHSVGLALSEKYLSETFNKPDLDIIDHYTYSICGDGDLMEGVSYEAASIAGHLKLGKLIVLFDSNNVILDGDVNETFSEDMRKRFESMNWQYLFVEDGQDLEAVSDALAKAKQENESPTIIEVKNIIGFGVDDIQGTHNAHSDPVGADAIGKAKKFYEWDHEEFYVPNEVYENFKNINQRGQEQEEVWSKKLDLYKEKYPEDFASLERIIHKDIDIETQNLYTLFDDVEKMSTRVASSKLINHLADNNLAVIGGSADLSKSNKTALEKFGNFNEEDNFKGRNIKFGVREFAMGTIGNALALSNLRPYVSTFFVFSDYLRPSIRLSALMKLPVTYIFTHDSVAVGQDGPTHQPVEHLLSFRAMPNINVIRPADAFETIGAWIISASSTVTPTLLALGRQDVPILKQNYQFIIDGTIRGAYVLEKKENAEGILIATGSEVHLALEAQERLADENIYVNVVSMPSWELFEIQTESYKQSVLQPNLKKRLSIELGSRYGWEHYTTEDGDIMSIDEFGESGAGDSLVESRGFTVENVIRRYKNL
ncbi:transketolase [Salinicoccus sesuvii]